MSACAFLGDDCATLELTNDIVSLHETYYEPLACVAPSLESLLQGPPVKKMLLMAEPSIIQGHVRPFWEAAVSHRAQMGASVLQAVPNMLELVPEGVNKWVGAQVRGKPHWAPSF